MHVPYVALSKQNAPIQRELLEAVQSVLEHGWFILGPEVAQFEEAINQMAGSSHCVGVNSGTDALVLASKLHNIGPGDEVITVSHSFFATATAVCMMGATPVFVDVCEETMLLDPAKLEEALTPKTKAVMPVHLNGYPCDMDPIVEFCKAHNLALIEDCAQAIGVRYKGKHVGTFGTGCFSLHPLKVLAACGDAGFVLLNSEEEWQTLRYLRNLGLRDRDHCDWVSGNTRLDTVQAAMLLVKLKHLSSWMEARQANAKAYREAFDGLLRLPPNDPAHTVSYNTFVVRHPKRDDLQKMLKERGVDTKIHYPIPIHQQKAFAHFHKRPLPVTEKVVSEMLSLPVSPELDHAERDFVIQTMQECLKELA